MHSRRRVVGALALVVLAAAIGLATAHAASTPSPYDGLIFRVVGNTATGPGGFLLGCPDGLAVAETTPGLYGGSPVLPATTIRASSSGASVTTASVALTFDGAGNVVYIQAVGHTASKDSVGVGTIAPSGIPPRVGCPPVTVLGASAAGTVYSAYALPQTANVDSPACVAVARTQTRIAATVQIGQCTPDALPAPPAGWDARYTPPDSLHLYPPVAHPDGSATISGYIAWGGVVTVSGKGIVSPPPVSRSKDAVVTLRIRPRTALTPHALRPVRLSVAFTPAGGYATVMKTLDVTLKRP